MGSFDIIAYRKEKFSKKYQILAVNRFDHYWLTRAKSVIPLEDAEKWIPIYRVYKTFDNGPSIAKIYSMNYFHNSLTIDDSWTWIK